MDFRLTEEQRLVRDTARDFVDRELIPHVRDWEEKGEIPKSFYRKMAGLGFLGAPVPEKYGGGGPEDPPVPPPLPGGTPRPPPPGRAGSRPPNPPGSGPPRVSARAGTGTQRSPPPPGGRWG